MDPLDRLLALKSQTVTDLIGTLDTMVSEATDMPPIYLPPHLRTAISCWRQPVHLAQRHPPACPTGGGPHSLGPSACGAREPRNAEGQEPDASYYEPLRARPERDDDSEPGAPLGSGQGTPSHPPPFSWGDQAAQRFRRAIILGDPGSGKSWLLRYEVLRLAGKQVQQLRDRTISIHQVELPVWVQSGILPAVSTRVSPWKNCSSPMRAGAAHRPFATM